MKTMAKRKNETVGGTNDGKDVDVDVNVDPSVELPRDTTGSYLHLKLKRFKSIDDLTMNYAKKTWRDTPHDAEVEKECSASRSSCKQCHKTITKGDTRFRLWLQCHKGCKNSAYFHKECIFQYPETQKLTSTDEFVGYDKLPTNVKKDIQASFDKMKMTNDNSVSDGVSKDVGTNKNGKTRGEKDSNPDKKVKKHPEKNSKKRKTNK